MLWTLCLGNVALQAQTHPMKVFPGCLLDWLPGHLHRSRGHGHCFHQVRVLEGIPILSPEASSAWWFRGKKIFPSHPVQGPLSASLLSCPDLLFSSAWWLDCHLPNQRTISTCSISILQIGSWGSERLNLTKAICAQSQIMALLPPCIQGNFAFPSWFHGPFSLWGRPDLLLQNSDLKAWIDTYSELYSDGQNA